MGSQSGSASASLILAASLQWSAETHSLFPDVSRTAACELLLLGHALANPMRFGMESGAFLDVWVSNSR
jgi:hypothetical protein